MFVECIYRLGLVYSNPLSLFLSSQVKLADVSKDFKNVLVLRTEVRTYRFNRKCVYIAVDD